MHVHELNPWRTLIALSLFIVLLIVGFLTMSRPDLTFNKNMEESLADLQDSEALFYPWQLESVINGQEKNVILIDIRDKFIYGQGNIPGSENISAHDLTLTENIKRLEDLKEGNITVVLCGEDQLQANGPWMLFRQMGLNVKILLGGYNYYAQHKDNLAESENDITLIKGYPNYDFAELAAKDESVMENSQPVEKETVVVERKQKAKVAAGGC